MTPLTHARARETARAWGLPRLSAKDVVKSLLTVDPAKRATPESALKHPWIAGEEASTKNIMDTFKEGLKKNPRERLRAAVNKVKVMNAFKNASLEGKEGEDD